MKQHRIPWCTSESLLTCCVSFAGRTDALLFQKRLFVMFFTTGSLWKANSLRAVCDFLLLSVIVSCLLGSTAQDESASCKQLNIEERSLLLLSVTVCTDVSESNIERGYYPWVRAAPLSAEISLISALISSVMMPSDLRDLCWLPAYCRYRAENIRANGFYLGGRHQAFDICWQVSFL